MASRYWYQSRGTREEKGLLIQGVHRKGTEERSRRKIEISKRSKIIKILLERRGDRHIKTKTLIQANKIILGGADVMALLLRQNGTRLILDMWWRLLQKSGEL
jgi:hypothetical protein